MFASVGDRMTEENGISDVADSKRPPVNEAYFTGDFKEGDGGLQFVSVKRGISAWPCPTDRSTNKPTGHGIESC